MALFTAAALVRATGDRTIPKRGGRGSAQYSALRSGLELTVTRPALAPLTLTVPGLSGVALEVAAHLGRISFREAMLFTHRGLSGPAILQISSYWREGREISIDLLPDPDAAAFLKERNRTRPKPDLRTALAA